MAEYCIPPHIVDTGLRRDPKKDAFKPHAIPKGPPMHPLYYLLFFFLSFFPAGAAENVAHFQSFADQIFLLPFTTYHPMG